MFQLNRTTAHPMNKICCFFIRPDFQQSVFKYRFNDRPENMAFWDVFKLNKQWAKHQIHIIHGRPYFMLLNYSNFFFKIGRKLKTKICTPISVMIVPIHSFNGFLSITIIRMRWSLKIDIIQIEWLQITNYDLK